MNPFLVFSDQSILEANTNKLSLIGIFDKFTAQKTPFCAPSFFVNIAFNNPFEPGELDIHLLTTTTEDGKKILEFKGKVVLNNPDHESLLFIPLRIPEMMFFNASGNLIKCEVTQKKKKIECERVLKISGK